METENRVNPRLAKSGRPVGGRRCTAHALHRLSIVDGCGRSLPAVLATKLATRSTGGQSAALLQAGVQHQFGELTDTFDGQAVALLDSERTVGRFEVEVWSLVAAGYVRWS